MSCLLPLLVASCAGSNGYFEGRFSSCRERDFGCHLRTAKVEALEFYERHYVETGSVPSAPALPRASVARNAKDLATYWSLEFAYDDVRDLVIKDMRAGELPCPIPDDKCRQKRYGARLLEEQRQEEEEEKRRADTRGRLERIEAVRDPGIKATAEEIFRLLTSTAEVCSGFLCDTQLEASLGRARYASLLESLKERRLVGYYLAETYGEGALEEAIAEAEEASEGYLPSLCFIGD